MATVIDAVPGALTEDLEGVVELDGDVLEPTATEKLMALAGKTGDFSEAISLDDLATLGSKVVEEYERDKSDRDPWEKTAKEALDLASQEHKDAEKTYPWKGASNVRFPLLTTAALQFNARAYPSIVKGDEAVSCKVVGQDRGRPQMGPDGQPMLEGPQGPIPASMAAQLPPEAQQQLQPMWQVKPGGKAARAQRVAEYMNTTIFYRMEDWESDTDSLLIQLPIVGCAFRKVWYDPERRKQRAVLVSAMRIFVPEGARSCETTPRLTEEIPDVYPHEISQRMRSGFYREVELVSEGDDEDNARLLLEQHRMMDLDEDGLEEPYVVTVDKATSRVLRIEANFGPEDIRTDETGKVLRIEYRRYYIKYDFFPHPQGKFYGIGLGHLLKQLGDVIDTAINQIVDTGTAAAAGGGFIGSGVRLQARGGASTVRFAPGEYKTVDVPGEQLRNAIVERTLPQVSPVTFQVLDMILGAAQDIAGAKDVLTGDASNTGQVGTTLALIEQGLQVFNAVYKRIYRALKDEFSLIYENLSRYGGQEAAQDYMEVLDDQAANFEQDFNSKDLDIRPVSDPSSVTRMQKMAKAQFLLGTTEMATQAGGNPQVILRRVYEAADVEDIDAIFPPPAPQEPDPLTMARAEKDASAAELNRAKAAELGTKPQIEAGKMQLQAAETQGQQQIDRAKVEIAAFQAGAQAGTA
jgi:chaperonin GroES